MKNKDIKYFIETQHFSYFLKHKIGEDFLQKLNCVHIEKSEIPDFILTDQYGNKHGVELTTICKKHPITCFFRSLDNIVKKSLEKLHQTLGEQFYINLLCPDIFTKDVKYIKFKEEEIVEIIFEIIKKNPNNSKEAYTYSFGDINITGQHHIVDFTSSKGVHMQLIYSKSDHAFGGTPIIMVPLEYPIELLQKSIQEKENKLKNYHSKCTGSCNLLVIYDPFIAKGLYFEATPDIYEYCFKSSFDNIFLLELGGKEAIKASKLNTQPF